MRGLGMHFIHKSFSQIKENVIREAFTAIFNDMLDGLGDIVLIFARKMYEFLYHIYNSPMNLVSVVALIIIV